MGHETRRVERAVDFFVHFLHTWLLLDDTDATNVVGVKGPKPVIIENAASYRIQNSVQLLWKNRIPRVSFSAAPSTKIGLKRSRRTFKIEKVFARARDLTVEFLSNLYLAEPSRKTAVPNRLR